MPIPRLRRYAGPAILSYGFRPFFLAGAVFAALGILIWLPVFFGTVTLPTAFSPLDWHKHEMLYGYIPAIVTGFLLTAIPNWTGRMPLQGWPVAVLAVVWIAGRLAVAGSAMIGPLAAGIVDTAFLGLVTAAVAREVIAGRNWRNVPPVLLLGGLAAGNVAFHLEDYWMGLSEYAARFGLAVTISLISLFGGRVVPSFTRNWLARENPGRLPVPFSSFDRVVLAWSGIALLLWVFLPDSVVAGAAMVVAGAGHGTRLFRWAGHRAWRDRLVLILHIAYAFIPLGFILLAGTVFLTIPASAGIHAWTVGAIGTMTLAMMTRASLGHTGHALAAGPLTQTTYIAVVTAALLRVAAAIVVDWSPVLLYASGIAWIAAFGLYVAGYGPILLRPRLGSSSSGGL